MSRFKYYISGLLLLFLAACAYRNYEWIRINPAHLKEARTAETQSQGVREVDMTLTMKEKDKQVYFEDDDAYLKQQPGYQTPSVVIKPGRHTRTNIKGYTANNNPPADRRLQTLNNTLVIPPKGSSGIPGSAAAARGEATAPQNASKVQHQNPERSSPAKSQQHQQKLQKQANPKKNAVQQGDSKKNSYLWIGLVLLVVGIIVGLIFGGMAYLISVAGIILMIIGYFTRI